MSSQKRKCYVIMPFSKIDSTAEQEWTDIYNELFKPAIEGANLGYEVERSEIRNGAFTKDIVQNLKNAYVVLADITHFNANVMWELGVRHALSKRTIMVARNDVMNTISDMKIYGVIPYHTSSLKEINEFKRKIKEILLGIEKDPERSDNPVFDFLKIEDLILASIERKQIIGKLKGLISELFTNLKMANDFSKGILTIKPENISLRRYYTKAINELLTTNYVPVKEALVRDLFNLIISFENANRALDRANNNADIDLTDVKKKVISNSELVITDIERLIKDVKTILDSVQTGNTVLEDSPIFLLDREYEKYLKDTI